MTDRDRLLDLIERIRTELSWMPKELPGEDLASPSAVAISAIRMVRLNSIEAIINIAEEDIRKNERS